MIAIINTNNFTEVITDNMRNKVYEVAYTLGMNYLKIANFCLLTKIEYRIDPVMQKTIIIKERKTCVFLSIQIFI
jgi:hypothetical protein